MVADTCVSSPGFENVLRCAMSALRRRAMPTSSESSTSGCAFGLSLSRCSSISVLMRDSSADICVTGSGGGGGGGVLTQAARTSDRPANKMLRRFTVNLLQNLEQTGCTHAAADAHRYDAKLRLAAAAFQ